MPAAANTQRKARHMATYSLEQLKADVDKSYAGLDLEIGEDDVITLANLLRLPKEARTKVAELLDQINEAVEANDLNSLEEHSLKVLELAAGKRGKDLLAVIGTGTALAMDLLSKWTESTQVGEADSSQS